MMDKMGYDEERGKKWTDVGYILEAQKIGLDTGFDVKG